MANDEKEKSSLADYGIYLFSAAVDNESCADVMDFILVENLKKKHEHLTLMINSPGGEVDSGFALIDVMKGSKLPIHTVGIGIIASMGLLIFITGKKGERILTPNTLILSHEFSSLAAGKHHELISARKSHDIIQEIFMRHYKKHTKLNESQIKKYLLSPGDAWITAQEAKEFGICDEVRDL